ncbi:MAG: NADP-dependent malic enzyme [Bacteroidetes bacterium]|nr:NADP-dependent malic enzyme [Bacteroidota bacterium]
MSDKKYFDALSYHADGRPGKIEIIPTKPTQTQRDLALAYSPGVAEPCLKIAENPDDVYKYTARGNLVAVISNGTAVLGLGDIGAAASKPVMEGKGILFKLFADIDVFDIELDTKDVDEFVRIVKALEPTFGGVNLEDIKAPESFEIEKRLKEELNIPIMHDDQHGTAIISGAALINALKLVEKEISTIQMVINGAGASAIACGKLFVSLGVKRENLLMFDSKGLLHTDRTDLDEYKQFFASSRNVSSLEEALNGADVFVGLSRGNILNADMIRSMAKDPIVFAMANPDPEIDYNLAVATREDIIMATGRSDFPNQVNNVLGFPFIFRGALDVRATAINEEMKLAAVHAIADLALQPVPEAVAMAYNERNLSFGRTYIIPKPMDTRLLTSVAPAVAKAAMDSGVARLPIHDWEAYRTELRRRLGIDNDFINRIITRARKNPKRVVFADADSYRILKAAQICVEEGFAKPILLGDPEVIKRLAEEHNVHALDEMEIIDTRGEASKSRREQYGKKLYQSRQRKGLTLYEATKQMRERTYFGAMMVDNGEADAFISGLTRNYPLALKPAMEVIGRDADYQRIAGMHILMTKNGILFFADTTVNLDHGVAELVDLTRMVHEQVRKYQIEPRIALVSYSNFGSSKGTSPEKIREAVAILHRDYREIMVDGEMQVSYALDGENREKTAPFCTLGNQAANVLIFPNLDSGNIAYQLMRSAGPVESIGPVLLGFRKSVHILHHTSSVREIANMAAIAVVDAQTKDSVS